jgi:hypothetical protein
MLKHAVEFYKTLFGKEPKENIRIGEDFWEEDELVTAEENAMLEAPFSEDEIKKQLMIHMLKGLLAWMVFPFCSIKSSDL